MTPGRRQSATLAAMVAAAGALCLGGGTAVADDVITLKHRISDSSSDRTPATTEFPTYPRIARRDRIEGDATVCFKIDMRGRIRAVRVQNYSHRIFRRPALRAIKASSFEPLQPDEVLSTSRTCRTYRFRLEPLVADNGEQNGSGS